MTLKTNFVIRIKITYFDDGEYGAIFDFLEFWDIDHKNVITMIKKLHTWLNFSTELKNNDPSKIILSIQDFICSTVEKYDF